MVPLNQRFVKNVGNYSESAARDFSSLLYIYYIFLLYILYIFIIYIIYLYRFLEQNRCYFF